MATEEQDGLADENPDEGAADSRTITEKTITTEHTSLAELRCGITLRDDIETEPRGQSSGSDDTE